MRRGVDGQIYSIHAPGMAALVLPAFAVAGYAGAVATVIAARRRSAWRWPGRRRSSDELGGGSLGRRGSRWRPRAVPPARLHDLSRPGRRHRCRCRRAGARPLALAPDRRRPPGPGWAIGAALALLPWLHTRFALLAGVLGVALSAAAACAGRGMASHGARLLAVPAAAAAAWFAYFWTHLRHAESGGALRLPARLGGRADPDRPGRAARRSAVRLAANAPVLLVRGLVGFAPLARRRPRLALELAAGPAAVPADGGAATRCGGVDTARRPASPSSSLPLLALPLARSWSADGRRRPRRDRRPWAASAAITAALVGVDRGAFVYNGRDGHALLLDWLSPHGRSHAGAAERAPRRRGRRDARLPPSGSSPACCWRRWQSWLRRWRRRAWRALAAWRGRAAGR